MTTSILDFFVDPILAAPVWATMLMCLASSLIGVLLLVRRRALMGEAIAHTTYPGIALMIYFAADFLSFASWVFPIVVILGAFISSFVGLRLIFFLEKRHSVSPDSSLCFVLSSFLGLGVLIASRMQITHPVWIQKIQMFLYGQAATITTGHVWIYAVLTALIVFIIFLFFPIISTTFFDREYSKVVGIKTRAVSLLVQVLLISAIVIGIRSVGVLMMSGMLIAPAAAARMVTSKFSRMFIMAAVFGVVSGLLGNMLSVYLSEMMVNSSMQFRVTFPTGPMILIVAVTLSVSFLLFARKNGLIWRMVRRGRFKRVCNAENILKLMYKCNMPIKFAKVREKLGMSRKEAILALFTLYIKKNVYFQKGVIHLDAKGMSVARRIIRAHRLWEVYLVSKLGVDASEVHRSAEEMEHIITPEIERELSSQLGNPLKDPHDKLIPLKEEI